MGDKQKGIFTRPGISGTGRVNRICEQCGETDAIRIKHLPLPDGSPGHITLSDWAQLCGTCIQAESVKYTALIDAAKAKMDKEKPRD